MFTKKLKFGGRGIKLDYEPEAKALFARMTVQPNDNLKNLINKTIRDLKNDGVWQLADCMYIRGVHTSQAACLNWIKNAHNSTLVNSPTFTPKVGFGTDGTMYINNNYTPSSDAINYTLNTASIALMMKEVTTLTNKEYLGADNTVSPISILQVRSKNPGNELVNINSQTPNGQIEIVKDDILGYSLTDNKNQAYKNGIKTGLNISAPVDSNLVNYSIYELCKNRNGSPYEGATNSIIAFSFYGGYLDATKQLALYNRIKYFYDNVNKTWSYDQETLDYVSGLSTPISSEQTYLVDKFVKDLKRELNITALSQAFDAIYILAGETSESSLRNLVKRQHDATAVNSPTFTQYEGFQSDGASKYLKTNYNPSTSAVNYTLNNAGLGSYVRGGGADGWRATIIGGSDGTNFTYLSCGTVRMYCAINRVSTDNYYSNNDSVGKFGYVKYTNNSYRFYVNDDDSGPWAGNDGAIPNAEFYMLCNNNNGTPNNFSNKQISLVFVSKYYTISNFQSIINNAFESYMDAHGKGIIT